MYSKMPSQCGADSPECDISWRFEEMRYIISNTTYREKKSSKLLHSYLDLNYYWGPTLHIGTVEPSNLYDAQM